MRIEIYRGAPFIDREEEIEFLIDWFSEVPQRILWVYGPKSSGKTTVMEYVIENHLLKALNEKGEPRYWVKYFNLREALISSYGSFLDTFFVEVKSEEEEKSGKVGINIFGFSAEVFQKIKKKQANLFKVFIEKIENIARSGKKCVMIIDEIQKLRDVYIENGNGERELLKEFLNFCVRLTKETHLCHIAILTSNTLFVERIYNDAKMKKTSSFYKIDHLTKEKVREWLEIEGLKEEDIKLGWEYFGGCIADLLKMIGVYKKGEKLEEFLKREAWLAYTEIDEYLKRGKFTKEEKRKFKEVAKEILEKGYFEFTYEKEDYGEIIDKWAEKEILFYDPLELKVYPNSKIYEKGLEILIKRSA